MTAVSTVKVMVVEDYDSMRALMRRCLEGLGFTNIRTARSPVEALSSARRDPVDLIISDYDMPGMNGLQFLESVRGHPEMRDIKFIMLSGSGDREVVRQAVALGVDEYLVKPIGPLAVKEMVKRLFGELT